MQRVPVSEKWISFCLFYHSSYSKIAKLFLYVVIFFFCATRILDFMLMDDNIIQGERDSYICTSVWEVLGTDPNRLDPETRLLVQVEYLGKGTREHRWGGKEISPDGRRVNRVLMSELPLWATGVQAWWVPQGHHVERRSEFSHQGTGKPGGDLSTDSHP